MLDPDFGTQPVTQHRPAILGRRGHVRIDDAGSGFDVFKAWQALTGPRNGYVLPGQ